MTAFARILTARKSVTAAAAALALSMGLLASATPAAAWTHHHRHHGYGWGAPVAAGVIGGLALGAMAASAAPAYDDCWVERRRVYNDHGRFVGFRRIRVCN